MLRRILIAEDETETRELLVSIATKRGYDVVAVADGVELLTVAGSEKFDVIITDLLMKDLSGASASEILKMQGNTTPVVALTALNSQDIGMLQDNFAKIYHKPCNVSELFEYVDSLIGA